ncbi:MULTISPECIES: hypothetical protein [unclassified Embleya]|uniref:hypothetical protein n=1 Tax=unclassified Embleya TaxID=2699296 RepID=UPI0033FE4D20
MGETVTDTWDCECLVEQGRARVVVPRIVDASVAHRLRKDLVARINALSDDVVAVTFDLMDTQVLDDAGAAAIASAYRHAFLLGLRPTWRASAPDTRAALLGADGELRTGEHALDVHPG